MELTDALFDLCNNQAQPIIAIDGPAGAGKTTLASHLKAVLSLRYRCAVLHMDSLYNGWDSPFDEHFTSALQKVVASHRRGEATSLPRYDWHHHQFGAAEEVPAADLLILEGVGSMDGAIRRDLTVTIWIDIDPEQGFSRVIARDGDQISVEMQRWLQQQAQHFLANDSKNTADFILTN
jgi:uridine kinase